jgi:long-chain acyl-CoA synthetase
MELEFLLSDSGSKILVMNPQWWPNVAPFLDNIPSLEKVFFTETDGELPDGVNLCDELFRKDFGEIETQIDEQDIAAIVYTSGTTGRPKGAMNSHFNVMHCAMTYERCFGFTEEERSLIIAPFFHVTGLFAQLTTLIYSKGTAALMSKFSVEETLRLIEQEKITNVVGTPTMWVVLMASPLRDSFDVSSVKSAGYGGAPMAEQDIKRLRAWIPNVKLFNAYGSTETTSPTSILPDRHVIDKGHTVGWPVPVAEVKVVDPVKLNELDYNQAGELWVKGPLVVQGYWRNPEGTAAALSNGWLRTGDVAVIDDDGFIAIVDRIKDMINRGGEKVFSVEVENVISLNQEVMEVAVVGVPDKTYGETVKAVVVPFPGQEIDPSEIKQWVKERMARYKVPQYVEIIDQLPRNPGGKVVKSELRYIPKE